MRRPAEVPKDLARLNACGSCRSGFGADFVRYPEGLRKAIARGSAAALQRRVRTRRSGTAAKVRFYVTFRGVSGASVRAMLIPRPATPTAPAVNPSPCALAREGGGGRTRSPRRHRA